LAIFACGRLARSGAAGRLAELWLGAAEVLEHREQLKYNAIMPPRIPIPTCLRAPSTQWTLLIRPFSSQPVLQAKVDEKQKRRERASHDPYIVAQRNRKKAANLTRRSELEQGRVASLGNPVRGVPTPFVESFDTGKPVEPEAGKKMPRTGKHLNYAFEPRTVEKQLKKSEKLAIPLSDIAKKTTVEAFPWSSATRSNKPADIEKSAEDIEAQNKKDHARAAEAIARITALENGSSKDRMRANINRCVQTFGRHNTDRIFPPRAPPLKDLSESVHPIRPETNIAATEKRIGPDTGSSEVQIAILTAKIKTMADFLATRGKNDKHNKRNLRVLVHRRQKLLQYLRRKERGGPRWQHCIETLGLTEGTWRGEISL
jgi:ribosomal protein S15